MRLKPNTFAMTLVLAMLTALAPLSTDLYLPSLPALARALDATNAQAQLTLSAFLVGQAFGQLFYGSISDKVGRKPVLVAGLAIFILATLACALAWNIETLIAARFVQAAGAAGPIVLGRAMVRDLYEGARAGRELSLMASIMGVVPAIAPVLGGFLEIWFGWRFTFVATLVFGLGLAIPVLFCLPETLRERSRAPLSVIAIVKGFGHLLRHPAYRVYVGLATLTYTGLFAFISGSSFVLQRLYGLSELAFSFSFVLMVAGFIGGTFTAQRLVGRLGLQRVVAIGVSALCLGGVLMLALVVAGLPSSFGISLPMMVYAFGVGLTLPQSMALAMAPFPDRAGAASSFLGLCQMSIAALIGAGLGQLIDRSALPLAATIAATGTLALLLFVTTRRARTL